MQKLAQIWASQDPIRINQELNDYFELLIRDIVNRKLSEHIEQNHEGVA
jgi:hypothetical protein